MWPYSVKYQAFSHIPILILVAGNLNMVVITLHLQLHQNVSAYGSGEQLGMSLTVINGLGLCNISGLESSCPFPIQCCAKHTPASHLIKRRCICSISELALLSMVLMEQGRLAAAGVLHLC